MRSPFDRLTNHDPRNKKVAVCLTENERATLTRFAAEENMKPGEFLRNLYCYYRALALEEGKHEPIE